MKIKPDFEAKYRCGTCEHRLQSVYWHSHRTYICLFQIVEAARIAACKVYIAAIGAAHSRILYHATDHSTHLNLCLCCTWDRRCLSLLFLWYQFFALHWTSFVCIYIGDRGCGCMRMFSSTNTRKLIRFYCYIYSHYTHYTYVQIPHVCECACADHVVSLQSFCRCCW